MTDQPETPIIVSPSALNGMLATFARDLLKVLGAGLVTKGVITASLLDQGIGILIAAAPIAYSQFKTLWNHRKLVITAEAAPASVAVVREKK